VSASFFSVARGNGAFDPRPIPDLAVQGRISRDPAARDLERFLRGLIVEEFSGPEPGESALGDLAAYVRAVKSCPGRAEKPVRIAAPIGLFRDSVRSAARASSAGDGQNARLLIGAARWQLGLIDERLEPGGHALERKALLALSRRLQAIRDSPDPGPALLGLLARFDRQTAPRLVRAEEASLYNPETVDRWLAARAR
jgi:hypothetical protein